MRPTPRQRRMDRPGTPSQQVTGPLAVLLCLLYLITPLTLAAQGVPVVVAPAQEQEIRRVVRLTGTVTSLRNANLSVATGGLVTGLHVDAGSRVDAGALLLELDSELAELQWRSARAGVEEALNARADALRRLEEARRLAPQRSIAETVVKDLEAEVAEDTAALHRAEAEAGYRRGILDRHQLRAPFPGVINAKLTETGEWVSPGQAVFNLVSTDQLVLDFEVPEDYLADVGPDSLVQFRLNARPEKTIEGKVSAVVPVTDPGARTFLLRIQPLEENTAMMPGMSARAELTLGTGRRGLAVSRDAILRYPDGRVVVWVMEPGSDGPVATERVVQTGLAFDNLVEVTQGLQPGSPVVIEGNETLRIGQRIDPRPAARN